MTPDFKEAPISQIPALRFLQQLGYSYLSQEETAVERKGKLGRVLLEDTLDSSEEARPACSGRRAPTTSSSTPKLSSSSR